MHFAFLLHFWWFKLVDTSIQGHRRHVYTLFHQNPLGIDGCSSEWVNVVDIDGIDGLSMSTDHTVSPATNHRNR